MNNGLAIMVFLLGTVVGSIGTIAVDKFNMLMIHTKFKVGDCLSNGLFYEKVREIRPSSPPRYVLDPTIQGHRSAPSTNQVWLVDDSYVLVAGSNCL